MSKVCCIFNIPSLYREKIYLEIDKEFDCEWFFEQNETDICLFDIKKLHKVFVLKRKKNFQSILCYGWLTK